jgi:hypothetical protein
MAASLESVMSFMPGVDDAVTDVGWAAGWDRALGLDAPVLAWLPE